MSSEKATFPFVSYRKVNAVFTFQIRKSKKFLNIFDLEITSNPVAAANKKSRLSGELLTTTAAAARQNKIRHSDFISFGNYLPYPDCSNWPGDGGVSMPVNERPKAEI